MFVLTLHKNNINPFFKSLTKKGMKMKEMHMYSAASGNSMSGVKMSVFGANSNMGPILAGHFITNGVPMIFNHRRALDVVCPGSLDATYMRSNPFNSGNSFFFNPDIVSTVKFFFILKKIGFR